MARINIEDKFWVDLMPFAIALGDQDAAIGQAVRFFRFAQEKAKDGQFLTEEEFKTAGFSESLFRSFAIRTPQGIQAAGFEKHFGWLQKRVAAGRKGGSKRKQTQANGSKPKQTEPSLSISPSSSSSSSYSSSSSLSDDDAKKNVSKKNHVTRFEQRFTGDRPAFVKCFQFFAEQVQVDSLKEFGTTKKIDDAMRAWKNPEDCWNWLGDLADTIRESDIDNPNAYAAKAWNSTMNELLSDEGEVGA